MIIELELFGPEASAAKDAGQALLRVLSDEDPIIREDTQSADGKRDLATGLAVAAVILAVPGAILATMDIAARLKKRRELTPHVKAVKEKLELTGTFGNLRIEHQEINLNGLNTDQIVDKILSASKE